MYGTREPFFPYKTSTSKIFVVNPVLVPTTIARSLLVTGMTKKSDKIVKEFLPIILEVNTNILTITEGN